jgi:hypothetical protein
MAVSEPVVLEVSDLGRALRSVEPAALLVSQRLLRRVIRRDRKLGSFVLVVPHRKTYVVHRDTLLEIVDRGELGLWPAEELPERVILLDRPGADYLARQPADRTLLKYWRNLFHARIDLVMQQKIEDGTLNERTARSRINQLGTTAFDEIARVLEQEHWLLPPDRPEVIYAEFVAVYLTLRYFAPALVTHFFPGLDNLDVVETQVQADVDAAAIFQATRLPGAPDPTSESPEFLVPEIKQGPGAHPLAPASPIPDAKVKSLLARAEAMDARGNTVRAAILRTRAAEGANLTLAGARGELHRLSERLQKALGLNAETAEKWRRALLPLLARAARGYWSQEARLLYDLQKICVDSERGLYAVDLVEWAVSFGKRPVKRPLPQYQEVSMVRHLRRAQGRLRYVRLHDRDREVLSDLLHHIVEHRERLMRQHFRPLLADAMTEAGFQALNVPEQIGRDKLIEELLDRAVDYGHINMGNLRDAISRNKLKMPDLTGAAEFVSGDPLIRLNRKLAESLDGVYRRGEIYMRLLHRISSLVFGTALGRFLMLYLILPFGLGFVVMVAPGLLVEEGEKLGRWVGLVEREPQPPPAHVEHVEHVDGENASAPEEASHDQPDNSTPKHKGHRKPLEMPNVWGWAACGLFFLLLFHVGSFRSRLFYGLGQVGQGLQTVFIRGPVWVLRQPLLQALLHNRFWIIFRRCVFWPCVFGGAGFLVCWLCDLDLETTIWMAALPFGTALLLSNTRIGRDVEETLTEMSFHVWLWITVDFVPGFLRLIMDVSRWCLEGIEQVLYAVDEYLRFHGGESRLSLGVKAILGLVWFAVTYVVRIYANLLIEPTVNPIKHFPVVTIGHKIMLPFLITIYRFLRYDVGLDALGPIFGTGFIAVTIFFIPGICGFVVWELRANWKLYRSNRPRDLKPVMIGSHGETMIRLLKPGFHSGTVPKLYRRLRKAERRDLPELVRKIMASLHHVEESVEHFIEREFLALLRQSHGWGGLAVHLAEIHLATNRIKVMLLCPSLDDSVLVLSFDNLHGWLVAGVTQRGWLPKLNSAQKQTLAAALAGLYKMAGVNLTREQVEESLGPTRVAFDITSDGLQVWQAPTYEAAAVYDVNDGPLLRPLPLVGHPLAAFPELDTGRLLFSNVPLTWQDWVRTWDRDRGLVNGDRRELAVAVLPKT